MVLNDQPDEDASERTTTFDVYTMMTMLGVYIDENQDAIQLLNRAVSSLERLHGRSPRGMRFIYSIPSNINGVEVKRSVHSADQEGANSKEYWVVPYPLTVVAHDADMAFKRLTAFGQWIAALHKSGVVNLPRVKLTVPERQIQDESFTLSIDAQILEMLFRFSDGWLASNTDTALETLEVDTQDIVDAEIWESLGLFTDTIHDAVNSLVVAASLLDRVLIDNAHWKWVFISAHNALQGFMVNATVGTNDGNVLKPDGKLQDFLELYKRIKSDAWMLRYMDSQAFKPERNQGASVKMLNRYRNQFMHFTPKGWRITPSVFKCFPALVDDIADIIYFLAFESGNVNWHKSDELSIQTTDAITDIRSSVDRISQHYYSQARKVMAENEARTVLTRRLQNKTR